MRNITSFLLLPAVILFFSARALCGETETKRSKGFEFIKGILAAEGLKDSLQLKPYMDKYSLLMKDILKNIDREDDVYDQNEDLFRLLHEKYLVKYIMNVRFHEIFDHKYYNCVTSTALYYALCLDLGFDSKIYATPIHVYLSIFQENKPVRIELTDPVEGFDFQVKDKDMIVKYLLGIKLITQEELTSRGVDSIYNEFTGETREISSLNLIQFVRSNAAIDLEEREKYDEAFEEIRSALRMDTKNKDVQNNYNYICTKNYLQYLKEDKFGKMDSVLSDALSYSDMSPEVKKDYLDIALEFITNSIIGERPFPEVEAFYNKCKNSMQTESFFKEFDSVATVKVEVYRSIDLIKKGYTEEAYRHVSALYKSAGHADSKMKDYYLSTSQRYVAYLIQNREYEKAIAYSDTLLQEFPDYPATQDLYTNVVVYSTMDGGLYLKDPKGTEDLLMRAAKIAPKNPRTIKAMTTLYHEYAMEMVRKNDYVKALKMVEEGLRFDGGDTLLLSDRELIKPKVKKNKQ